MAITPQKKINVANETKYWESLMKTGNAGQQKWAQAQAAKYGVKLGEPKTVSATGTATGAKQNYLPQNYNTQMTPTQIDQYAKDKANNQFANEKLGFDHLGQQYKQQMGQLYTDDQMKKMSEDYGKMKYMGALTSLDNEARSAETNRTNQMNTMEMNYARALEQMRSQANEQRGRNLSDSAKRGLYNSSILSQQNSITDTNEMNATQAASENHENNINNLDNEINTILENINKSKTTMTEQQGIDMTNYLDGLMKTRNDERDRLNLALEQNTQGLNQARNNITQNQNDMYMDLYDRNRGYFTEDRQFNADQKWKGLYYELDKKKVASGGSGGGYPGGGYNGPTGKTPTTPKPTGPKYNAAFEEQLAKDKGQLTPSQKMALGAAGLPGVIGPISDAFASGVMRQMETKTQPGYNPWQTNTSKAINQKYGSSVPKSTFQTAVGRR